LPEALHFHDFEQTGQPKPAHGRIHINAEQPAKPEGDNPVHGHVKLHE
jgi:hypothetical protein